MAQPGDSFELDGAIRAFVDTPASAWEPFEIRSGHNVYRSAAAYPSAPWYGGFIQVAGRWLPLAVHFDLSWLSSDVYSWQSSVPFYMGPGIAYSDGHIYVRLDNSAAEAQCHRAVSQIADPDPRHQLLPISAANQFGLRITHSNHVFQDFTAVNNYYGGFVLDGDVRNVTFRRVGGRVLYFGGRLGRSAGVTIEAPAFDGYMDPGRWWVAYSDVKGSGKDGIFPADRVRKCGLDYNRAQDVQVTGGYFHDFFDGALSEAAHDIDVGHVEFRTWDDAWQMYGSLRRIDLHDNLYLGAGPSRDGSATDLPNPDPGTLWIHDNIIDTTRYRVFWFRGGHPDDPSGIGWREPIPFSAHNVRSKGFRTIPWKLYRNTIVTGIPGLPINSYVGVGQFGTNESIVEARHEAYNNLFIVRNARGLGQDTWVASGAEIYDGNVYWGWHTPAADDRSIWRFSTVPPPNR